MNREEFYQKAEVFLGDIDQKLKVLPIEVHWDIDHICYRVDSLQRYRELCETLDDFGSAIVESEIGGRPITTFRLNQPLLFRDCRIDLLELPAPKPGRNDIEGFEHLEFVIDQSFDDLNSRLDGFEVRISKKAFNGELSVKLDADSIKFHHMSLDSVVRLETARDTRVFSALNQSEVLSTFASRCPVVVGTFPLGIATEDSDLDILFQAEDFASVLGELHERFSSYPGFESNEGTGDDTGETFAICRFQFEEIPFEIFIQDKPTVQQRAFRHFQVEERLLKWGGAAFRKRILELRQSGSKTEPAFAQALGLSGGPYIELERIHSFSHVELRDLISSAMT